MNLLVVLIFAAGGLVCHQRPERSFFVDGHQLPVCARCTGLYLSGALGILGWLYGKTMGLKKIPAGEMKFFNRLSPLAKWLDKIMANRVGLSLIVVAEKTETSEI